jgi:hypothetical protein
LIKSIQGEVTIIADPKLEEAPTEVNTDPVVSTGPKVWSNSGPEIPNPFPGGSAGLSH